MRRYEEKIRREKGKKSHFAYFLVLTLEALAIVMDVLERSRIARFLSTKAVLSVVVEVTDRFGARAGHRLSTFISAVVAEPLIAVYIIAGILAALNLLVLVVRLAKKKKRTRKPGYWD